MNRKHHPPIQDLRGLLPREVEALVESLGEPRYRAEQIFRWIHRTGVTSTDEMTNLGKELRRKLADGSTLTTLDIDAVQRSDDGTRKLRLRCYDGELIESVLIPKSNHLTDDIEGNEDKVTLCISSQVGCALGCRFCATATLGIKRNLAPGEIVDQVYRANTLLDEGERISNLVFMGMGEPMANLDSVLAATELLCSPWGQDMSPRRITISTVGLVPGIRRLGQKMPQLGLAISLHATTDELRERLMPINKRWPLAELTKALRDYPLPRRRRITFEYMVLAGLNDQPADVKRLTRLLDRIKCKINLLPFNPWRDDQPDLKRPSRESIDDFADGLRAKGLTVTVRESRGLDISAACGQLALSASPATESDRSDGAVS
jgi:23S rRNA (adenine2503-C2)-methyltransferase